MCGVTGLSYLKCVTHGYKGWVLEVLLCVRDWKMWAIYNYPQVEREAAVHSTSNNYQQYRSSSLKLLGLMH